MVLVDQQRAMLRALQELKTNVQHISPERLPLPIGGRSPIKGRVNRGLKQLAYTSF